MKKIQFILTAAFVATLLGCVNSDEYDAPDLTNECVTIAKTKEVIDITSTATATATAYTADDVIEAYEVSKAANDWFTKMLGLKVRLVYMPENSHRKVSPKYAITGNEINSFSDGYPFLVIGIFSVSILYLAVKSRINIKQKRLDEFFYGEKILLMVFQFTFLANKSPRQHQ